MTAQAANPDDDHNVELIWKSELDWWMDEHKGGRVQVIWECVLCGENTCVIDPDPAVEGPAAFIHLMPHKTLLTVCVHCADRCDGGTDLLEQLPRRGMRSGETAEA
jgi:hypothetical protein